MYGGNNYIIYIYIYYINYIIQFIYIYIIILLGKCILHDFKVFSKIQPLNIVFSLILENYNQKIKLSNETFIMDIEIVMIPKLKYIIRMVFIIAKIQYVIVTVQFQMVQPYV